MPSKVQGRAVAKSKARKDPADSQAPTPLKLLPQWPPLRPLMPTADLSLETLLEDQIIVTRNFFTSTLCKTYVAFLSSLPLLTTPAKPKDGNALRLNDRIQFDDPCFADALWKMTGLESLVKESIAGTENVHAQSPSHVWGGEVIGLNPKIRIYRYKEGQFFAQHYDEANVISLPTNPPTPARTTWTLLIYLTGPATGCVGGETAFYPELGPAKHFSNPKSGRTEPVVVELEVGMALLHKHGQDCLLHEGRKVMKGEKWVIRTDLCVRR